MDEPTPTIAQILSTAAGAPNTDHIFFVYIKTSYKAAADVALQVATHIDDLPFTQYVRWTTELLHPETMVLAAVRIPAVDQDEVTAFDNLDKLLERIRAIPGVRNPTAAQVVGGRHYPGDNQPQPHPVNGWP